MTDETMKTHLGFSVEKIGKEEAYTRKVRGRKTYVSLNSCNILAVHRINVPRGSNTTEAKLRN